MPGTPGTLSTLSPTRAWKSTTWSGAMPQSSRRAAASKTWFLRMLKTATRSVISCRQSLSPVTMKQFAPRLVADAGERGQHVVGLVTLAREDRDRHRLQHPLDLRNLADELVRHFAAVGLVGVEQLVAERRARQVEGTDQRVGLLSSIR